MKLSKQVILSIATLSFVSSLSALAQAEVSDGKDLYELAGPNAAFVRMVNLGNNALEATLEGETLSADGVCSVSRTRPVLAGQHVLQGEGWSWQNDLKRGEIYTVIVNDGQLLEISTPLNRDPMKANFEVFNLQSAADLDVVTVAGARSVFEAVPARSRKARTLNPLRVELQLNSDSLQAAIDPIAFARGKTTTLLVCGSGNSLVSNQTTE